MSEQEVSTGYLPESQTYRVWHEPTGASVDVSADEVARAVDPSGFNRSFSGGINWTGREAMRIAEKLAGDYLLRMKSALPAPREVSQ